MDKKSHIYIVCSDQTRNGKTLFARLFCDFLTVQGANLFVVDLDAPVGGICDYYPDNSEVFDISKVQGQMEVFDWVLGNPGRDYIIDVPARYLDKFFTVMDDISFVDGAGQEGLEVVVFYLVEGDRKSLDNASMIHDNYTVDRFFVIRHDHMNDDLREFDKLSMFHEIAAQGQIVLPSLDRDVLDLVEDTNFSFRAFIEGEESDMPAKQQFKLATYLETVIDAVQRIKRRIDIGQLSKVDRF